MDNIPYNRFERKPIFGGINWLEDIIILKNKSWIIRILAIIGLILIYLAYPNTPEALRIIVQLIVLATLFYIYYAIRYIYEEPLFFQIIFFLFFAFNAILLFKNDFRIYEPLQISELFLINTINLLFILISYFYISEEKIKTYVLLFKKGKAEDELYYRILALKNGVDFIGDNNILKNKEIDYCLNTIKRSLGSGVLQTKIQDIILTREKLAEEFWLLRGSIPNDKKDAKERKYISYEIEVRQIFNEYLKSVEIKLDDSHNKELFQEFDENQSEEDYFEDEEEF